MTEIPRHLMERAKKARLQAGKVSDAVDSVNRLIELENLQNEYNKLRTLSQELLDIFIEGGYTESPDDERLVNELHELLNPTDPLLLKIEDALHHARSGGLGAAKTEGEAVRKMALAVRDALEGNG